MKITIDSKIDKTPEELFSMACEAYVTCKDHINKEKNVTIKFETEDFGLITQQGKLIPFAKMNKR